MGKKNYILIFVFIFFALANVTAHDVYCSAASECDSICPNPQDTLRGRTFEVFYQTITLKVDTVLVNRFTVAVDSFTISSVDGLPEGLTWASDCGVAEHCRFFPGTECIILGSIPVQAGTYTVSINGHGYSASTGKFPLNFPNYILVISETVLDLSVTTTEVSTFGACDGSATVAVADGTAPHSFLWSTGDTTSTISGQCSNKYTVVVTDARGLTDSINAYISEPSVTIGSGPYGSTTIDTITGVLDTCVINCENPVDSAIITSYRLIDSTHAVFYFTIYHYQNGNRVTFSITSEYTTEGPTLVRLQLNCSGTFLRALKTCNIEDQVNISYSDIGPTQVLIGTPEEGNIKGLYKLYPNPFKEQFSINLDLASSVIVTDVNGKEMHAKTLNAGNSIINTAGFAAGMYFVRITNNKFTVVEKMIKK